MPLPPRLHRTLTTAWTFAKSTLTGMAATAVDFVVLVVLVEIAGFSPGLANVPALLAGAAAQFVGNRHFVFAARGRRRGALPRQLALFVVAEGLTLALNALAFHLLAVVLRVPYAIARPLGTFVVFALVSYPLWRRIFGPGSGSGGAEPADPAA